MSRRVYEIETIKINNRDIGKVIIDEHTDKHADHINDELILKLIQILDKTKQIPEESKKGFDYFVNILNHQGSKYKLVWVLEENEIYIGVITVFKDRRE